MADRQTTGTGEKRLSKRKRFPLSEEAMKNKKESDKRRGKTRVHLSWAFNRWRELRDQRGFKTDVQLALFLMDHYAKCSMIMASIGTGRQKPASPSRLRHVAAESSVEMEVTIEDEEEEESNSVKNRQSDLESDMESTTETTELSAPGADDSCDGDVNVPVMPQRSDLENDMENTTETTSAPGADDSCDGDVYVPVMPQSHKMSELKLECEEEELEPWQKHTKVVHFKEEQDFGELDCKPDPSSLQSWAAGQHTVTPEACGVVHTSKGLQISNDAVSLSSVKSPDVNATSSNKLQSDQSNSQTLSVPFPLPLSCLTVIKREPHGT